MEKKLEQKLDNIPILAAIKIGDIFNKSSDQWPWPEATRGAPRKNPRKKIDYHREIRRAIGAYCRLHGMELGKFAWQLGRVTRQTLHAALVGDVQMKPWMAVAIADTIGVPAGEVCTAYGIMTDEWKEFCLESPLEAWEVMKRVLQTYKMHKTNVKKKFTSGKY